MLVPNIIYALKNRDEKNNCTKITKMMELDHKWIREHLPDECRDYPEDLFAGYYLLGLKVMSEGERGGPDTVVYEAENEEDLKYWQLEQICRFIGKKDSSKTWRYYRHHADESGWLYIEHRHYDYNAIEDTRLPGFERLLKNLKYGFPPERWEEKVKEYTSLMNFWYEEPHWDYDRENLCFIEISDSKEHDDHSDIVEEPRPGSVIQIID